MALHTFMMGPTGIPFRAAISMPCPPCMQLTPNLLCLPRPSLKELWHVLEPYRAAVEGRSPEPFISRLAASEIRAPCCSLEGSLQLLPELEVLGTHQGEALEVEVTDTTDREDVCDLSGSGVLGV